MKIFIDESGDFDESARSKIGIIVIVSIPDKALNKFSDYLGKLLGEKAPTFKSSDLSMSERERIINYVGKHNSIKYSAFVFDHKSISEKGITNHKNGQLKKLESAIQSAKANKSNPKLVSDLELLYRQIKNFKSPDYLKMTLISHAYEFWAQTCLFDFYYIPVHADSWEFEHIFDMQNNATTFIRLTYNLLSLGTNHLHPNAPKIATPIDWPSDHPIHQKYGKPIGMDMREFYKRRRCGNDQIDLGLKIPDIISNTMFRSFRNLNEEKYFELIAKLWPNRSFTHKRNGGKNYYQINSLYDSNQESKPSELILSHWKKMMQYYR